MQPAVNGIPSDDSVYGWGGAGGRVYQKAYVELFVPPNLLNTLLTALRSRKKIDYIAVDASGHTYTSGVKGTTDVHFRVRH
jgi:methylenetetrahydrofolate reductase (NADPH)